MTLDTIAATPGSEVEAYVVLGLTKDGSVTFEMRTPIGKPFDINNAAQVYGLFVARNGATLMPHAMQMRNVAFEAAQARLASIAAAQRGH